MTWAHGCGRSAGADRHSSGEAADERGSPGMKNGLPEGTRGVREDRPPGRSLTAIVVDRVVDQNS